VEGRGFISPGDLELFKVTDDPKEAVADILHYFRSVGVPHPTPKTLG
jgi:predicted Rossmann-fold nucleotide-binding protein